ncbi:MAG: hypothetical protein GKR94_20575 [Gammaproteobacteria bacterium]|nr:hypothetical protein [Gammaproteobacteria bacterium]
MSYVEKMNPQALAAKLAASHGTREISGIALQALEHPLLRHAAEHTTATGTPVAVVMSDPTFQCPSFYWHAQSCRRANRYPLI